MNTVSDFLTSTKTFVIICSMYAMVTVYTIYRLCNMTITG